MAMKKIWRWIQQIDRLQQPQERQATRLNSGDPLKSSVLKSAQPELLKPMRVWNRRRNPDFFDPLASLPPQAKRNRCSLDFTKRPCVRPAIAFTLAVLTLTAAMGQRYYRQPELQVGTLSPKTVLAPDDASVVDQQTTEEQRSAARNGAVPVLVPDPDINDRIINSLDSLFNQAEIVREQAGEFPLFDGRQLSTSTQTYIREAPAADWDPVWSIVTAVATDALDANNIRANPTTLLTQRDDYQTLDARQQQTARGLVRYQQLQSAMDLQALQIVIETARSDFQSASTDLERLAQAERGVPNDPALLRLDDQEWAAVQKQIRATLDQMLLQGIAEGVPVELLAIAAANQLNTRIPKSAQELSQNLLVAVLEPNLVKIGRAHV